MSEVQAEAPATAPRGYFPEEPAAAPVAEPIKSSSPVISKTGEAQPPPESGGGTPLPTELYEDRYIIVLALRLEGYSYQEIEQKTGLSKSQVRAACKKARSAGKLRDVIDLIDNRCVPQAVENLMTALEDPKDKHYWEATEKTLDGRGVFRKFNQNKNEGAAGERLPALQINVVSVDGGALPAVIVNSEKGSVIGTGREDDDDG